MVKKLLIGILIIALIIELILTSGIFFATEITLKKFGVPLSNDTSFPAYLVGWFLLFVSLVCGLAIWQVIKNKEYAATCYLLGFWWIGIGVGIYIAFGKPDNLFLDSLKGLIIILLTRANQKK